MIYAGFWKRLLALILDGIFLWIVSMVLIIPFYFTPFSFLVAIAYHLIFETSPLRATPGKALMKIAVLKSNGQTLGIKDSLLRFLMTFVSAFILGIGYILALFTEKNQTLHDFVADTVVVEGVFTEDNFWKIFLSQMRRVFSSDPSANVPPVTTVSESLEDLYNLFQKGILTEEEYRLKKEEYLRRL